MAVTKNDLVQYYNLKQEEIEVDHSIEVILSRIDSCEMEIYELERETVKDKVYGGFGGEQGFVIEGMDERDLAILRARLIDRKNLLAKRLKKKQELKEQIDRKVFEIDKFMNTVTDSLIRRIIYYRYIEHFSWNMVAAKIGGNNTEDSVRKALDRYLEKDKLSDMSD